VNWDMGTNERPTWKAYVFCLAAISIPFGALAGLAAIT